MYFIKDTYKKRLDLYFDEMPAQETRNFLKAEGWRWDCPDRKPDFPTDPKP